MFHSLLLDPDTLVHLSALEAFTQFAESTKYESVIPDCIGDDQKLQDTVVAFLSKVSLALDRSALIWPVLMINLPVVFPTVSVIFHSRPTSNWSASKEHI